MRKREMSHSFVRIEGGVAIPQRSSGRPENLSGDDFARELARLAAAWCDERFLNAFQALFDYGIIKIKDGRFRFCRIKEPGNQQIDCVEEGYIARARALVSSGMSMRAACDQVVAEGYPGSSDELRKRASKRS